MQRQSIAGLYKDYMDRLPVPTGPRLAGIREVGRPSLEQMLQPLPQRQKVLAQINQLPSPAALGLLMRIN